MGNSALAVEEMWLITRPLRSRRNSAQFGDVGDPLPGGSWYTDAEAFWILFSIVRPDDIV